MAKNKPDFYVDNGGMGWMCTCYLLQAKTKQGIEWVVGNMADPDKGGEWEPDYPRTLAVEHRYIEDILYGIVWDGLTFTTSWAGMKVYRAMKTKIDEGIVAKVE